MRTEDYTPDLICQTLGIGPFNGPWKRGEPSWRLRLLFCPSFAPEICVTFGKDDEGVSVSVAAARSQLWSAGAFDPKVVDRCVAATPPEVFDEIEAEFRSAIGTASGSGVSIDGMPTYVALRQIGGSISVADNPSRPSQFRDFCAKAIKRAFDAIDDSACRNGLADAGAYVGIDLPRVPESELTPITRVSVLGAPKETSELLAALSAVEQRRRKARQTPKKPPHRPRLP